MSETRTIYETDKQILTDEQIKQIVEAVRFVTENGFGKITVWIEKGHPVLIGIETTEKFIMQEKEQST